MGEVELIEQHRLLIIHSDFYFYGNAATGSLAVQLADDIQHHWNEPNGCIRFKGAWYDVWFQIRGVHLSDPDPEQIWYNTNPRVNYFRIEEFSPIDISFVDGLGCNTGFFKLANLLQTTTTAAHEYGHTLGLHHPQQLDIRGKGIPGIMFPRGTLCDPQYQYDPQQPAGVTGGTLDPRHRKVQQADIEALKLHKLRFEKGNLAVLGAFSSIYHTNYANTV